jgi:hypothetical protein
MDRTEIQRRWFEHQPIQGAAFHLNDSIEFVAGPHVGATGSVIDLLSLAPEPRYLVELASGEDLRADERELRRFSGKAASALADLQHWYSRQTDGDWEHSAGVQIGTLDNPGWYLKIELEGTELEHCTFDEVRVSNSPIDWVHCRVSKNRFEGFGGPLNLDELLHVFNTWASGGASSRA